MENIKRLVGLSIAGFTIGILIGILIGTVIITVLDNHRITTLQTQVEDLQEATTFESDVMIKDAVLYDNERIDQIIEFLSQPVNTSTHQ